MIHSSIEFSFGKSKFHSNKSKLLTFLALSNNFSSIEVSNIDILSLFKILIFLEKPINRSKITERVGSPVDETRGEIGRRDAQHSRNQNAA